MLNIKKMWRKREITIYPLKQTRHVAEAEGRGCFRSSASQGLIPAPNRCSVSDEGVKDGGKGTGK